MMMMAGLIVNHTTSAQARASALTRPKSGESGMDPGSHIVVTAADHVPRNLAVSRLLQA